MELQAVTAQLHVVEGDVQEGTSAPGVLAQSAPSKANRGRRGDFLFVHLTLSGSAEETAVLTQDLLDLISQRYYQASGSVTAALRRALLEANERLLRLNLSGSAPVREGAATCAVFRHGELFLVQAGEALAFLGHNFGVERIPPQPAPDAPPMGRSAGLDLRYHHHRLQVGDTFLLADPRLAHLPARSFAPALVDTEVEMGTAALSEMLEADTATARLLLVEFTDELPTDIPEAATAELTTPDPVPEPTPQLETAVSSTQPTRPQLNLPEGLPQRLPRPEIDSEEVKYTARKTTSQAAMGLSRFTGWLAELLDRLFPPTPAEASGEGISWAWPTVIVIVIPLLVALIFSSVYLRRGRVQQFADLKQEMNAALIEADAAEDEAIARQQYGIVLTRAAEAEALRPEDSEVNRLRQSAFAALDRLDGVTRLSAQPLYAYDEEETTLTAVTLRPGFNGGLYALDDAGAVYQHETDESYLTLLGEGPAQLIAPEQALGNYVVGQVVELVWRPRGTAVSRAGLGMLDQKGALLTFFPNFADTRAVPLGLASEWVTPLAATTYNERLYILDSGAARIWKYFPDGEGFVVRDDDRAITFSDEPNLGAAVDFDLYSEDASLLLVYGDGRVRYYDTRSGQMRWNETDLLQNGLNTPLIRPIAAELVGTGLNTSIFVADPGSGRLVQISRGGTVLAQYRASDEAGQDLFRRITDFTVAETPLRVFVTAGDTLYVATQE